MVSWSTARLNFEAIGFAVRHGYPVPKLVMLSERLTASWGRTYSVRKIIKLRKEFVEKNSIEVVRALLAHEIVHLVYPGHGDGFKKEMKKHGYQPHVYQCELLDINYV